MKLLLVLAIGPQVFKEVRLDKLIEATLAAAALNGLLGIKAVQVSLSYCPGADQAAELLKVVDLLLHGKRVIKV